MRISNYLQYLQELEAVDVIQTNIDINRQVAEIEKVANRCEIDIGSLKSKMLKNIDAIKEQSTDLQQNLQKLKSSFRDYMMDFDASLHAKSRQIYQGTITDSPEYILDRFNLKPLWHTDQEREFFFTRVGSYCSWQYPGLQFRPAWGDLTDYMKGCDPLYLVDTSEPLFLEVKQMFSAEYQRRLRYYVVDESKKDFLMDLPHGQIGTVAALDYFNYKDLRTTIRYLRQIYELLKPGGAAIFTYNNCDTWQGIQNVENVFATYMPRRTLEAICKKIGFNIIATNDSFYHLSWIEISKPGNLYSIRGGQSLAKIKHL